MNNEAYLNAYVGGAKIPTQGAPAPDVSTLVKVMQELKDIETILGFSASQLSDTADRLLGETPRMAQSDCERSIPDSIPDSVCGRLFYLANGLRERAADIQAASDRLQSAI